MSGFDIEGDLLDLGGNGFENSLSCICFHVAKGELEFNLFQVFALG